MAASAAPVDDNDPRAEQALWAAAALALDPQGLGGAVLRAQAGGARDAWVAALRVFLPTDAPVWRLPLNISDDRLLGGLDLAATLNQGAPVAQVGLLAQAHGGVVLAAMAERLSPSTTAQLCAALDSGQVRVEREGISRVSASRFALVALDEALADDTPLSAALADRLGLWLDLSQFSVRATLLVDQGMQQAVQEARALLPQVQTDEAMLQALCATTQALGVHSPRAAWQAWRAARASAALRGSLIVEAEDATRAVQMVLAPRATQQPQVQPEDTMESEPGEPPEPPEPPQQDSAPAPTPDEAESAPPPPAPSPPAGSPDEVEAEQSATPDEAKELQDQLVQAALASIPPGLLARLEQGETARGAAPAAGRSGAASASRNRGRPLGARAGAPHAGARLHLIETLRAAAPWQRLRQQQAEQAEQVAQAARSETADGRPGKVRTASATAPRVHVRVRVRSQDFHVRRFEQRRTTTTIFAIDASGSSALHRLGEAKGAVELLLAECYVRRDEVAVIAFRGRGAELLLPPTRSLVRAKRGLAGLPGGGGTPLAQGIEAATQLAHLVRRRGATPVIVLLTDGRANVTRSGEGGRARAQEEALQAARVLRAQGGHVLLIDTSPRADPAALALAVALGARYLALPQANAQALSRAVAGGRG